MHLTKKELELMDILWNTGKSMTATEIIEASKNRTWKEKSIFAMLRVLLNKGAITLADPKPTTTIHARAYKVAVTPEEYSALYIEDMRQSRKLDKGMDMDVLIEHIKKLLES